MCSGANLALSLCPLLTQGQIEALEHHADDGAEGGLPAEAGRRRLDRDDEPDRAAGRLGRRRGADPGRAARRRHLRGHRAEDLHLLGRPRHGGERLPPGAGAAAGRRRRAPGASRSSWCRSSCRTPTAGRASPNAVRALSLEHKMGLHGSPTCVMEFDGATGWLVGEPHAGHGGDVHDDEQRPARGRGRRGWRQAEAALQAALGLRPRAAAGADAGRRGRDDRRPCRRAADAGDDGGDGGDGAGDLPRLRAVDRHGAPRPARRPGRRGRRS